MAKFKDITGKFKNLPKECEHQYMIGDKFAVEFKDGTDQTFKHCYGGLSEVCEMVNLDEVKNIFDV